MGASRGPAAAALASLALALAACVGEKEPGSVAPGDIPDPTRAARAWGAHDALVCPPGACAAEADRPAPAYRADPAALFEAWRAAVEAAPRTTLVAADPARRLLMAQQKSPTVGFVDTVTVRVLPAEDGATFAAYSASEFGWRDFGVNAARLRDWQAEVERRLGAPQAQASR